MVRIQHIYIDGSKNSKKLFKKKKKKHPFYSWKGQTDLHPLPVVLLRVYKLFLHHNNKPSHIGPSFKGK